MTDQPRMLNPEQHQALFSPLGTELENRAAYTVDILLKVLFTAPSFDVSGLDTNDCLRLGMLMGDYVRRGKP